MWELIDSCWIQERWSTSITPKGGFFCEVAAAQDMLFDGPGGYPLEKNWWKKTPDEFKDQMKRYCANCSAAVPMPIPSANDAVDFISLSNEDNLKECGSRRFKRGGTQTFVKKMSKKEIEKNKKNFVVFGTGGSNLGARALINILTNAVDAIEKNGTIRIKTVSTSKNVVIQFVDSGVGVPPGDESKIFDPMFTTKSYGSGLGLTISKMIIEQHGGKLEYRSNPSTFSIFLPKT